MAAGREVRAPEDAGRHHSSRSCPGELATREKLSERWDAYWGRRSVRPEPKFEALAIINAIEQLDGDPLPENALCLDIGCGDGYVTGELARHFGWRVVACDISGSALDMFRASSRSGPWSDGGSPHLVRSSVFSCPFGNAQFDLVTSFGRSSAATYWPDAPAEVARVLKPGGVAIFDFVNHFSLYYTLGQPLRFASVARRFVARNLPAHSDPNVSKMYHLGPLGIREFFDRFGLEIEASRFAVCHPPALGGYRDLGRRIERGVPSPLRPLVGRSLIVKFRRRPDG